MTGQPIALVGGPASGKTTIGKALAKKLGYTFLDTDHWVVETSGLTIPELFKQQGEPAFRALETEALKALLCHDKVVIATGGGVVKKEENRQLLRNKAFVIYLDVSVRTQLLRTRFDTSRPLLNVPNKKEALERLRNERDPWYREVATQTVSADQAISKILKALP